MTDDNEYHLGAAAARSLPPSLDRLTRMTADPADREAIALVRAYLETCRAAVERP